MRIMSWGQVLAPALLAHTVMATPAAQVQTAEADSARVQVDLNLPPSSCNTPTNRSCWLSGFDINTDWETITPRTGITQTYTFTVTEVDNFQGPDGAVKKKAMLINGQFPGPTIRASKSYSFHWGDTISVNVHNRLKTNGTGIHWHGLRQLNNNINDGVPGVTECPIPPGHNKTYVFTAAQYGTSWYHTHVSSQYAYGTTGSIHIDGPASLNYDVDLGPFPISDWYYGGADELLSRVSDPANPMVPGNPGVSPPSDNLLFNGTNINPQNPRQGRYAVVRIDDASKRHRLRLINPSVDNSFVVSVAGHIMTVIASDFVPVQAYTTTSLFLGVGQRYDVILVANQSLSSSSPSLAGSSFWINATLSTTMACGTSRNPYPAAILYYSSPSDRGIPSSPNQGSQNQSLTNTTTNDPEMPSSTTYPFVPPLPKYAGTLPPESLCADNTNFVPLVSRTAPLNQFEPTADNTLPVQLQVAESDKGSSSSGKNASRVFWQINSSAIDVDWGTPTLQTLLESDSGSLNVSRNRNLLELPESKHWSFWLIENKSPAPHPMHLHGHDFLILGQSPPLQNPLDASNGPIAFNMVDRKSLKNINPVRRDATMLPSWGWLLVAFEATNPGAWLFHCHIAWHISQGLSVQFLERRSAVAQAMDLHVLDNNCRDWLTYAPSDPFARLDSGL